MRIRGVVAGVLLGGAGLLLLWGSGLIEPPEGARRRFVAFGAAFPRPPGTVTVDPIPCAPLPRLRFYVVCTDECRDVWKVVGVRGLRVTTLASYNRIPPPADGERRLAVNGLIAREGLELDEAGARGLIGCHLRLEGLLPDLVLTELHLGALQRTEGDEEAMRLLAEGLRDPAALERLEVTPDGEGWRARFLYWQTGLAGRPAYDAEIALGRDGTLREFRAADAPRWSAPRPPGPAGGPRPSAGFAPEPIEQPPQPRPEGVEEAPVGDRPILPGKEAPPQLGGGPQVGAAHLPEQPREQGVGRAPRGEGGGKIDDVRPAVLAADDVVAVQVAVRHAARVEILQDPLQRVEEGGVDLAAGAGRQRPSGDVVERDRLAIDAAQEPRDPRRPPQQRVGALLAIQVPGPQEQPDRPRTRRVVLHDHGAPRVVEPVDHGFGAVASRVDPRAGQAGQAIACDNMRLPRDARL